MRARSVIALLIASLFAASSLQAATLVGPSSKTETGSSLELTASKGKSAKATKKSGKKAKKKKGKKGKKGKGKACGKTYMYWDKKAGKCADARNKKKS
jgi:hypothetical protein